MLILTLFGLSLGVGSMEDCPNQISDDRMAAECQPQVNAMIDAAAAKDPDVLADAKALQGIDEKEYEKDCVST